MSTPNQQVMSDWDRALDAFSAFLDASTRKPATCEGYLRHLGWLASSTLAGPWDLTTAQLAAWLDERNWSRDTRRKVLVSYRTFWAWAVADGLCEWAPTAGLPSAMPRKRGPKRSPKSPAWESAIDGFVAWYRAGNRGEGTIDVRLFWLRRLAEVSADPWLITSQQLSTWLSNPDWSGETKRAARSTVRTFYTWAHKTGLVDASPAEDLQSVLIARGLPRPAPDDALRTALAEADDRTRLAIMLAGYAGLRRAEVALMHCNQIGDDELLVVGKGGHQRRVPIHPDLALELRAELARRRRRVCGSGFRGPYVSEHGYLFPSDRDPGPITPHHMGKLISAALPDGWTAHSLRHRFATSAYAVQRDLRAVQELLGHAKPETTAIYAAVPDGALRTAVAGVGLQRLTDATLPAVDLWSAAGAS